MNIVYISIRFCFYLDSNIFLNRVKQASNELTNYSKHFWRVRRIVSIWNCVWLYGPMMGSRYKILGSGGTSYPTYLGPLVSLLCIFSLWRPATSVKMNGYQSKLNRFFVWIFSIDWYLNWPHWALISWDMVHWQVLGGVYVRGLNRKILLFWFSKPFLVFWVNRPCRKRFQQNNLMFDPSLSSHVGQKVLFFCFYFQII